MSSVDALHRTTGTKTTLHCVQWWRVCCGNCRWWCVHDKILFLADLNVLAVLVPLLLEASRLRCLCIHHRGILFFLRRSTTAVHLPKRSFAIDVPLVVIEFLGAFPAALPANRLARDLCAVGVGAKAAQTSSLGRGNFRKTVHGSLSHQ